MCATPLPTSVHVILPHKLIDTSFSISAQHSSKLSFFSPVTDPGSAPDYLHLRSLNILSLLAPFSHFCRQGHGFDLFLAFPSIAGTWFGFFPLPLIRIILKCSKSILFTNTSGLIPCFSTTTVPTIGRKQVLVLSSFPIILATFYQSFLHVPIFLAQQFKGSHIESPIHLATSPLFA